MKIKLPKFLTNAILFIRDRAPEGSHMLAMLATLGLIVFVIHCMQDLDHDPIRYPFRDYHDEARLAKRKASDNGVDGYYFNYEGHTYFQPATGGHPYYIGPAEEPDD